MPIIDTITNDNHFAEWCKDAKRRDSDYGHFSYEAANAIQAYFEEYSDSTGEPVEFDPIAWCVEFSEYDSVAAAYSEHYGDDSDLPEEQKRTTAEQQLEYFQDNTTVIELDNGGIVLGEF